MKATREERGLSQKALATLAGIREFTVSRIEAGIIQPDRVQREKLEKALRTEEVIS